MPKFNNILIVGLGMMGGSLCKSIKKNKLSKKISAFDTDHDALSYACLLYTSPSPRDRG